MGNKIKILMCSMLLTSCTSQEIGRIEVYERVNVLTKKPTAIQNDDDADMLLQIVEPPKELSVIDYGHGKDFMYFKVRLDDSQVGYVMYHGRKLQYTSKDGVSR